MNEITGKDKILFGTNKETNEKIYLEKPTWDCGWYWSFGYLGNKHCHYHLSNYAKGRNIHMYDALINDYDLNDAIKSDLWEFCELAKSIYIMKESAELLGRGGAHYTNNPMKDIIQDKEYTTKLNDDVLPKVMQFFWNKFST